MWWNIISKGATIAEIAKQIYTTIKKETPSSPPPTGDLSDLYARMAYLEKNEVRQAELIKQMAEQNNAVAKKAQNAFLFAVIATILALISFIWQLVH